MSSFLNTKRRKEFIGIDAPRDYIPGVGRGATGFTTRSDIGPARESTDVPDERHHQFKQSRDDDENENLNDSNFDEFSGYSGNLCSKDPYDDDDLEADKIYENIDVHMDERRKEYRERRLKKETEEYRRKRPKIQQGFADLKREMNTITFEEWMNIPEVGDKRNRKQRNPRPDSYLPKPDSLISMEYSDNKAHQLDPNLISGLASVNPTGNIDLQKIGKARTKLMDCQLGRVSDSVGGQTVIDPKGYLTDLQSNIPRTEFSANGGEVHDIKKARLLLKSIIDTNPEKVTGWIAMVRFEESFSKIHEAKQYVMEGCKNCPDSEDMWIEAIRIMKTYGGQDNIAQAKSIAARAIKHINNSVSLWVAAANLEDSVQSKRAVFQKALLNIIDSVKLWKLAIELEDEVEARGLLKMAVNCCPTSVDLWLALAKLSKPQEARDILNLALRNIPNDRKIWIAACKLEEAEGNEDKVDMLVKRALKLFKDNRVEINREEWIKDAEDVEISGSKITAQKIIQKVIEIEVDEQDRKHTWLAEAESCEEHGCYECARAIYSVCMAKIPNKKGIWKKAAAFEKEHGTRENYENVLSKAVENCPNIEVLWLMLAKSKWEADDVNGSRNILSSAFSMNPNSEEIMLAAVKLESENNEFERARRLLQKARSSVGTGRVWMKSARLEWCLSDLDSTEQLLIDAVSRFPTNSKLWMMLGQLRVQNNKSIEGLEAYKEGCLKNPHCGILWTLRASLEESFISVARARNTLEKARSLNITSPEIWIACIRLELRAGNQDLANNLMSRSLQNCPDSGILWAENVNMVPRSQKLAKAKDALSKCEHNEHVLLAAAKVFWEHGFDKKAREWIMKSVKAEKLFGDAWAYLYKLECIKGTESSKLEIIERCVIADPRFGEYWCSVSKDVQNWKLKTKDILLKVATKLPLPIFK